MLKFYVKVFYVMGKALSGELSCPCDRSCYYGVIICLYVVMFFLENKICSNQICQEMLGALSEGTF